MNKPYDSTQPPHLIHQPLHMLGIHIARIPVGVFEIAAHNCVICQSQLFSTVLEPPYPAAKNSPISLPNSSGASMYEKCPQSGSTARRAAGMA